MTALHKAIISGVGHDRPGIVSALTGVLARYGCNIEDSTMTRLASEFAVILIIQIPDGVPYESLSRDFEAIGEQVGMTLVMKPLLPGLEEESFQRPPLSYFISVAGRDRTGITHQVAQLLAEHQINITDLNAQIIEGEDSPVYVMMLEVDVPAGTQMRALEEALRGLSGRLAVEIQLRPLEVVSL